MSDRETRRLLVEQLRAFYGRDWVSGTGGGICGPAEDGNLLVAPTGVHKELVQPEDLFVIAVADTSVVRPPANDALKPSECSHIFTLVARERGVRSVVHTHALSAVLAADLAVGADHILIRDLEMLKGIRGLTNQDVHLLPVIDNTAHEKDLVAAMAGALADPRFDGAWGVVVVTTAATSGVPISGRRSATPRSITTCSTRSSRDTTAPTVRRYAARPQ